MRKQLERMVSALFLVQDHTKPAKDKGAQQNHEETNPISGMQSRTQQTN